MRTRALIAVALLMSCNARSMIAGTTPSTSSPTATSSTTTAAPSSAPSGDDSGADGSDASNDPSQHLTVPDLVGLSLDQANAKLHAAGFQDDAEVQRGGGRVVVSASCKDGSSVDHVCAQAPVAGEDAPRDWTVEVVIGIHDERLDEIAMPDVHGMSIDDAKRALAKAGFAQEPNFDVDTSCKPKTVCSQMPHAGDKAHRGSLIVLSAGP